MKFSLSDGSVAHLVAIIQNRNYQMGYRDMPSDATEEVLRIAQGHLSKDWWRPAPLLLIGQDREKLNTLLRGKKLPPVLCIGLFYSIRGGTDRQGQPSHLYVIWLQDEFLLHMSAENQAAFAEIKWPNPE